MRPALLSLLAFMIFCLVIFCVLSKPVACPASHFLKDPGSPGRCVFELSQRVSRESCAILARSRRCMDLGDVLMGLQQVG